MRYAKQCKMIRRCGGCGKKMVFECAGKFRVNANGRRLDVWLIYRCQRCGHTWNIPLYERISPESSRRSCMKGFWTMTRSWSGATPETGAFSKAKDMSW